MWKWWKVFNLNDFEKLNVPDYYLQANLDDLGLTDIVLMRGFNLNVLFQGYILTPFLNNRNAFSKDHKVGAYIDSENQLWVGMNENNM